MSNFKLYIWRNVCNETFAGYAFAYARTLVEARAILLPQFEKYDIHDRNRIMDIPDEIYDDKPYAAKIYGGE